MGLASKPLVEEAKNVENSDEKKIEKPVFMSHEEKQPVDLQSAEKPIFHTPKEKPVVQQYEEKRVVQQSEEKPKIAE